MRAKEGGGMPQARKRDQYTLKEPEHNLKTNRKAEIIPKLKPAAHLQTSRDRSRSSKWIAQMCLDLNHATKIYVERELKTNVVN